MRNNQPRLILGKRTRSNGRKLQYRKFWLDVRKNISPWRYSTIGTGTQRWRVIAILGQIPAWAGQAPFCNWTFLEPWIRLETSRDPLQHKWYVLNFYSRRSVTKMKDRSSCLELIYQTPLHLPCKCCIRDCSPETPLWRKTSFHNATTCTDCNSQQEQRCNLPWTLQRSRPWGHWQNWVRSLAPWWWGLTIDSSPTALCWAHPQPVLGTSALLRAWHTYIYSVFICANIYLWACFVLFVVWGFFPSAVLLLLFLHESGT